MKTRTYSEFRRLKTFNERFEYLNLQGEVGESTFGFDRYLNQNFYRSREWKQIRDFVIVRDNGCDLGVPGREIFDKIIIHHMNPISDNDLKQKNQIVLDPEFLICVSHNTHNALHFGDSSLLLKIPLERKRNDTCPWREGGQHD